MPPNKAIELNDTDITGIWIADELSLNKNNISALITAAESTDFYTRLHCIQLLTNILKRRPRQTQQCIVASPLAVPKLVDLLDDKNEAIRNNAILLLQELVSDNIDIAKIVAFENCFEKLLNLLNENDGLAGGIICADILNLIYALLYCNSSNQAIFIQLKLIDKLAPLFDIVFEPNSHLSASTETNLSKLFQIFNLFCMDFTSNIARNQNAILQSANFEKVVAIAFSHDKYSKSAARDALNTLASIVKLNKSCQRNFEQLNLEKLNIISTEASSTEASSSFENDAKSAKKSPTESNISISVRTLMKLIVNKLVTKSLQMAAINCFQALVRDNAGMQSKILDQVISEFHNEKDSVLHLLLNFESEEQASIYAGACLIMAGLVRDNKENKMKLANTTFKIIETDNNDVRTLHSLIASTVSALYNDSDPRITTGFLVLLCDLIYECEDNILLILSDMPAIQSLINFLCTRSTSSTVVLGLIASFLLLLYGFAPEDDSPVKRSDLYMTIAENNGRDMLLNKVQNLRKHSLVMDFPFYKNDFSDRYLVDPDFVEFFKENYVRIRDSLEEGPELSRAQFRKGPSQCEVKLQEALLELQQKENDISEQIARLNEMKNLYENEKTLSATIPSLNSHINELEGSKTILQEESNSQKASISVLENDCRALREKLEKLQLQLEQSESRAKESAADLEAKSRESRNWMKSFEAERAQKNAADIELKKMQEQMKQLSQLRDENKQLKQKMQEETEKSHKIVVELNTQKDEATKLRTQITEASKQYEIRMTEANKHNEIQIAEANKQHEIREKELQKQLANAKNNLAAKEAEVTKKQTEMKENDDEWVLVLEDLEGQIKKLKSRLKDAGQPISDNDNDKEDDAEQENDIQKD